MEKLKAWMSQERGRVTQIALLCKIDGRPITSSAVHQWKKIPAEYVEAISTLSGISNHELRPDVFCKAEAAA